MKNEETNEKIRETSQCSICFYGCNANQPFDILHYSISCLEVGTLFKFAGASFNYSFHNITWPGFLFLTAWEFVSGCFAWWIDRRVFNIDSRCANKGRKIWKVCLKSCFNHLLFGFTMFVIGMFCSSLFQISILWMLLWILYTQYFPKTCLHALVGHWLCLFWLLDYCPCLCPLLRHCLFSRLAWSSYLQSGWVLWVHQVERLSQPPKWHSRNVLLDGWNHHTITTIH